MRKVERLVNLTALLLDTHRPLTLDQIAELVPGYEATGESLRRMFERDKEELRGLGVPVERTPIDACATDERAALALAARAWSGGGAGDAAAVAGLAKLDLDPGAGPDTVQANLDGTSPLLAALLEAVTSRKRIGFSYQPPGREPTERRLEPDAMPIAIVRADESAARLAELRGAKREGDPDASGRVTLRLPVGDPSTFLMWAIGNAVEVVEPPELRAEAASRLGGLLDLVDPGQRRQVNGG